MTCLQSEITIARRDPMPDGGHVDADADAVVWLTGEHDFATKQPLSAAIARAARRRHADVLIDLSEVTFMDASTLGALVGAHNRLRARSHSLRLRAPSPPARRLLELCDLAHLVQATPAAAVLPMGAASRPTQFTSTNGMDRGGP